MKLDKRMRYLDVYRGCDEIKGCIAPPRSEGEIESNNCFAPDFKHCEMLVTFGDNTKNGEMVDLDLEVIFEVYHPSASKWIAVGFGETAKMVKEKLKNFTHM